MLVLRTVLSLLLVLVLALPAMARDEEASSPLLEAMALLHPRSDPVVVDFVDWAQLKRLYDSESITSSSPLEARQRFMLEVARHEAVPVPLGLDRLPTWPDAWGWDNTDLDWQAQFYDGRIVLRFGEHWDPEPFRTALRSAGFELTPGDGIEVWQPPEAKMPTNLRLESVGHEIEAAKMSHSYAAVTISRDGRTVIIHAFGAGARPKQLRAASRSRLERIAATPAVLAASALGDVVAASVSEARLCTWSDEEDLFPQSPEVGALVEGLHRYRARSEGYGRAVAGAPASIRYVFTYERPGQAQADLETRSALVEQGLSWGGPDSDLRLAEAQVNGTELILDVVPVDGYTGPYVGAPVAWAPFMRCGDGPQGD